MMQRQGEPASVFYPARRAVLDGQYKRYLAVCSRMQTVLLLLAVAVVALFVEVLRGMVLGSPLLAAAIALAVMIPIYVRTRYVRDRYLRLFLIYGRAMDRITGKETQSGNTGEEFRVEGHLYERDLNILGTDSLFGLLDTVRTGVGQRGLAALLLQTGGAGTREAVLLRREAIQEMTHGNDLRETIAMMGPSRFQQVPAAFFDKWLEEPAPEFHPLVRLSLVATTSLMLVLVVLGLSHVLPWDLLRQNILAVLAIQGAMAYSVRKRVLPLLESSKSISTQLELFRDGLALLHQQPFESERLKELQRATSGPGDAVKLLRGLWQQCLIVEQRTKEWFLIPSLLLCAGTHAVLSIAQWKRAHADEMKKWLEAWAEFEALGALATYAYEHPAHAYPEILPEGEAVFEAVALAHPLLPEDAVTNDIALQGDQRIYVISGSNMAGKSTLLRAIGVNAVLAMTGAPVRATSGRMSALVIGASIALSDSLAEGRSKFLAEVERLQAILEEARPTEGRRVLFLIDEIFSGTNSQDRKVAAEAVTCSLADHGAIGALSTHDLTLTEMVQLPELCAINVHMASPDAGDPLAFDYRLKPGVNRSSNALAIVRMIGIEL